MFLIRFYHKKNGLLTTVDIKFIILLSLKHFGIRNKVVDAKQLQNPMQRVL